jgi:hypothetical protein
MVIAFSSNSNSSENSQSAGLPALSRFFLLNETEAPLMRRAVEMFGRNAIMIGTPSHSHSLGIFREAVGFRSGLTFRRGHLQY